MDESPNSVRKVSFFFVAIVSALLFLSFISLYQSIETYRRTGSSDTLTIIISTSAIAISTYMILKIRKRPLKLGFEPQKVYTITECSSCSYKNTRNFEAGDYVFRQMGSCPKCESPIFISSIFAETTEKDQES